MVTQPASFMGRVPTTIEQSYPVAKAHLADDLAGGRGSRNPINFHVGQGRLQK